MGLMQELCNPIDSDGYYKVTSFDMDGTLFKVAPDYNVEVQSYIVNIIGNGRFRQDIWDKWQTGYKERRSGRRTLIECFGYMREEAKAIVNMAVTCVPIDRHIIPFPELQSLISQIDIRGLDIWVLTHSPGPRAFKILELLGLTPYIKVLTDASTGKDSGLAFKSIEYAYRGAGVEDFLSSRVVHAGDKYRTDIEPAKVFGYTPVLLSQSPTYSHILTFPNIVEYLHFVLRSLDGG